MAEPIPPMDPELIPFMRIPPAPLSCRGTHTLADGATCIATARTGGDLIAAGGYDDAIVLLKPDMSPAGELEGHPGGTNALAWASATVLVSAGEDGTAAVWDCGARECKARVACEGVDADKTPDGHTVGCVAISPDGTLAAAAAGKTVHLFSVTDPEAEGSRRVFPPVERGVVTDLRFIGPHRLLAAYFGGVVLFSTDPGVPGLAFDHAANIMSVDATPDLSWIVGGCADSSVHIWSIKQLGGPPLSGPGVAGATTTADAEPTGSGAEPAAAAGGDKKSSASAESGADAAVSTAAGKEDAGQDEGDEDDEDRKPVIIEAPGGVKLEVIELTCGGYAGKVSRVDFGKGVEGEPLMASSGGNACMVWDFGGEGPGGTAPTITLGHTKAVDAQAWHPTTPGVLATGGRDGRLLIYETHNAAGGMEEGMPALCGPAGMDPAPKDEVVAVAWTADGTLVSAHSSGDIKSWSWGSKVPQPQKASAVKK